MRLFLLAAFAAFFMSACGTINAGVSAGLTNAAGDYASAKKNVQLKDDMAFKAWADAACALPLGSLQRNDTGNPAAVGAALTACPIPNVGVVQVNSGGVSVQLTNIQTK